MSIEENKALIRRFVEAVNTGDEATLTQIIADDFTICSVAKVGTPMVPGGCPRTTIQALSRCGGPHFARSSSISSPRGKGGARSRTRARPPPSTVSRHRARA